MKNTLYHRAIKPWVFPKPNNTIGLVLRTAKETIKKIKIIFGDPMSGWNENGWVSQRVEMQQKAETPEHVMWEGQISSRFKRFRYAFEITTNENEVFLWGEAGVLKDIEDLRTESRGFTYSYWIKTDFLDTPAWFKHTSWYQIFPDRFAKVDGIEKNTPMWDKKPESHELYGGNIKGVIKKLAHIKELGFNGIYLTPIFEAETSHRYETKNYYKIDPILGTEEEFKDLINECHRLGMKIMLDAVFNHIGYHSKQFQDVIKNKEQSKYKDWFWINDFNNLKQPEEYKENEFYEKYPYETFGMVPEMPRLNWSNVEVREYLIQAAEKWTKLGVDGWRLDVSFEPPIYFWREFNTRVKNIKKDIVIIGEVWWDSIKFLENDIWHGIMNYPVRDVILRYLESNMSINDKKVFVENFNRLAFTYTPEQQWGMFNLMSSHDVARLITILNNDEEKFKLGMSLCFLQPGAPSTYYGQEIGLEGSFDPDNRRTYPWHKNSQRFFQFFKELNKERNSFVNTSEIHDRFVAKLEGEKIILQNSTNKIIVSSSGITREEK